MTRFKLIKELFYFGRALLRDGPITSRLLRRLISEERDAILIAKRQEKSLYITLQHAIRTLPYYGKIDPNFSQENVYAALRRFPIIDKHVLLANSALLYPHGGKSRPWYSVGKSSGTTGTPIKMFRSLKSVLLEMAFVKRQWAWNGVHEGMRRATLRGDMIVPLDQNVPPFWYWNRYNNQLFISSRHLKAEYIDAIICELERFSPMMLQAYPSTAYTLSQFLERQGKVLRIDNIFTSSEPLYDHQRQLIEERLGGQVRDMYGMAERVAFATACEFGEMHINPDYSYVEIVDDEGNPTTDYGYVVGTTLHNLAMPLVRYRLSDRTRWKPGKCQCGRPFPMIEPITGKYEDAIFGSNGDAVSPSVLTFAFKGVSNILKSQVAQVAANRWELRIVPTSEFTALDQEKLIKNIHSLVDAEIDVSVKLLSDIPNTAAGKFRWVVNESMCIE